MNAFEGLYPLEQTINCLLGSPRISIESSCREILEHARYSVKETLEFLHYLHNYCGVDIWSKRMKALEAEISEAASGLEDAIDSLVSDQLSETDQSILPLLISLDLGGVRHHAEEFTQKMKYLKKLFIAIDEGDENESFMAGFSSDPCDGNRTWKFDWFASKAASMFSGMKADYIQELHSLFPIDDNDPNRGSLIGIWWVNKAAAAFGEEEYVDEEEEEAVLPESEFTEEMVGLTDQFCEIRDSLLKDTDQSLSTSIWGMAGLGKTALAVKIMEDRLISSSFESRIFVRIGPKYEIQNLLKGILAQLDPDNDTIYTGDDEYLLECLWSILDVRKTLIVFDDVWDTEFWNEFIYDSRFYGTDSGSRFLVTTRLKFVAKHGSNPCNMRFLDNKESWDLLQKKVFVGEACPRELEKARKQIAENCEGLPLLIITVANLLSNAEKTPEYWSKIASSKKNSIFIDAYEKISKVLFSSYSHLPVPYKICFLYLGAFPQNSEVRISKLVNLWGAEKLRRGSYQESRVTVESYLDGLVSNSVALVTQRSSFFGLLKACTLHSAFWYLSKREAWNEKLLHVLDSHLDASVKGRESRRRLSVYKNSIFSIKDVTIMDGKAKERQLHMDMLSLEANSVEKHW